MRTVELGQFTEDNAERIVERLDTAGIAWFVKRSGPITRLLSAADWGTRVFVDVEKLDAARDVARGVTDP